MNQVDIALIACSKSKKKTGDAYERFPALELYTGPLFTAQLRYARHCLNLPDNRIFVLSAKHGLLTSIDAVVPYEQELKKKDLPAWGRRVWNSLEDALWIMGDKKLGKVHLMAGKLYREGIMPYLTAATEVEVPHSQYQGYAQQYQWYAVRSSYCAAGDKS